MADQDRLDDAINRLTDVSNDLKQMIAVHDQKFNNQEELNDVFYDQIEKLHKRIGDLRDEVIKKIEGLERWRWAVLGGAGVIGFALSSMNLVDLFK